MRIIVAGILGAVIYFMWGFVSWTMLPFNESMFHGLANEQAVTTVLQASGAESGVYVLPYHSHSETDQAAIDAWMEKANQGPVATVMYKAEGMEPMAPKMLITGFFLDLLAAVLAATVLAAVCASKVGYLARAVLVAMLGGFAGAVTYLAEWNYMGFPLDYSLMMTINIIVGWLLAGLGMAAIIKPKSA